MDLHLKTSYILGAGLLGLAALVGMTYLLSDNPESTPETASLANLVASPPKETFAPIFAACAHCHQIGRGAQNSTGPVLTGLIDRPAASTSYPFSKAMRESGLVWDETTLRAFLSNPHKLVPGTRMAFAGLKDADITELLNYIRSVRSGE